MTLDPSPPPGARAPLKLSREMKVLLVLLLMLALIGGWYLWTTSRAAQTAVEPLPSPNPNAPVDPGQTPPPTASGSQGNTDTGNTDAGNADTDGPDKTPPVTGKTTPGPDGATGSKVAVQANKPVEVPTIPPFGAVDSTEPAQSLSETPPTPQGINPDTALAALPSVNPFEPVALTADASGNGTGSQTDSGNADETPTPAPDVARNTPSDNTGGLNSGPGVLAVNALPGTSPSTSPRTSSDTGSSGNGTGNAGSATPTPSGSGSIPIPRLPGTSGTTGGTTAFSPTPPVTLPPVTRPGNPTANNNRITDRITPRQPSTVTQPKTNSTLTITPGTPKTAQAKTPPASTAQNKPRPSASEANKPKTNTAKTPTTPAKPPRKPEVLATSSKPNQQPGIITLPPATNAVKPTPRANNTVPRTNATGTGTKPNTQPTKPEPAPPVTPPPVVALNAPRGNVDLNAPRNPGTTPGADTAKNPSDATPPGTVVDSTVTPNVATSVAVPGTRGAEDASGGTDSVALAPATALPTPSTPAPITQLGSDEAAAGQGSGTASASTPLDALIQDRDLALNAAVLGPVNTAILRSKDGFVVVSVGQTLPDSAAVLKEVTATTATIALGDDTKTLELDKR